MEEKWVRRNIRVLEDRDEMGNITPVCVYHQHHRYTVDRVVDGRFCGFTMQG